MSDQGERGVRNIADQEDNDDPNGSVPPPRMTFPEVEVPAPEGRTEFSAPEPVVAHPPEFSEANDVRVAPAVAPELPPPPQTAWEGSLFDSGGDGDPRYAPVSPSGPSTPPKPGTPSSGNWRMPDWIQDDDDLPFAEHEKGRSSRIALVGGVTLLVIALVAAGAAYLIKKRGTDDRAERPPKTGGPVPGEPEPQVKLPPDKALPRFSGRPSRMLGRVDDSFSGLSYPRFAAPWQIPTKRNKLAQAGWSGQQIVVTEQRGRQMWYGQLLTGRLNSTLLGAYRGPESIKKVTAMAAAEIETTNYGFRHRTRPLASQAMVVDGHRGWLIASYLTYKRAGFRATGEVVVVGVVDTGRKAPSVVHVNVPNTHRKLWPDINQFVRNLKVKSSAPAADTE